MCQQRLLCLVSGRGCSPATYMHRPEWLAHTTSDFLCPKCLWGQNAARRPCGACRLLNLQAGHISRLVLLNSFLPPVPPARCLTRRCRALLRHPLRHPRLQGRCTCVSNSLKHHALRYCRVNQPAFLAKKAAVVPSPTGRRAFLASSAPIHVVACLCIQACPPSTPPSPTARATSPPLATSSTTRCKHTLRRRLPAVRSVALGRL